MEGCWAATSDHQLTYYLSIIYRPARRFGKFPNIKIPIRVDTAINTSQVFENTPRALAFRGGRGKSFFGFFSHLLKATRPCVLAHIPLLQTRFIQQLLSGEGRAHTQGQIVYSCWLNAPTGAPYLQQLPGRSQLGFLPKTPQGAAAKPICQLT